MNFLKLHSAYENKAVRILLKEFRRMSGKIPFEALTKDNAESVIKLTISNEELSKALFKVHLTIGKSYGNMEARRFRREIKKWKPLPLFNEAFQLFLLNYYKEFGGENITLLTETYVQAVVTEIRKATFENETVIQMRDRIFKTVNKPNFYKWQALRIARTETTFAMNSAKQIAGEVSGLVMEKVWIAAVDSRTRQEHLEANGKAVPLNEPFIVGGEKLMFPGDKLNGASAGQLINCYLPGSTISSNIIEGQRSFYSGKAIEIVTRGGKRISITPNHKVLTKNGFVAAKDINIGYNLLCNKVNANRFVRLVNNYINKKFFTVENVFSTLQKFWSSKHWVVSSLDFDKDGVSMNGNIDIVYPEIKLVNSVKTISNERINYFCFIKTFFKRIFISGFSPLNFFSGRNQTPSTCFMSFLYLAFPSCFIHFRPLKNFALGLGSTIKPQRFKLSGERNSGDTEFLFQLIKTHSRIIEFDDVVDVRNFTYVGHVYDFTSYSGTNIVNNIYTSNCRCTVGNRARRDANGDLIFTDGEVSKPIAAQFLDDDLPAFLNDDTIKKYKKHTSELNDLEKQYNEVEALRRASASKVNEYYSNYKKKYPKKPFDQIQKELDADDVFQALRAKEALLKNEPQRLKELIKANKEFELIEGKKQFKQMISALEGETEMKIVGYNSDVVSDFKKIAKGYNSDVTLKFAATKGREGFDSINKKIYISSNSSDYTILHELSHSFELDKDVLKKSVDFWEKRTAGNSVRSLSEINKSFRQDEYFKDGGFYNPYVGKFYKPEYGQYSYNGISATEIISMGIEKMYRNPTVFYNQDKDHFMFIYNLFFKKR